jgi:hypothetical protein
VDGALRLWRRETDTWVATIAEKLASPIVNCAFSPKGDYIVAKLASGHLLAYPSRLVKASAKNGDSNESSKDMSIDLPFKDWLGPKAKQTD